MMSPVQPDEEAFLKARTAAFYLGATLLLSLSCGMAHAGPTEDLAREHTKAATAAFNLGHYDEAVVEYEAAYRAVPDPVFLYNIGQSHRLAGNNDKALVAYRSYLRTAPPNAANRAQVEKHVEQLEALTWTPGPAPRRQGDHNSAPIDLTPRVPPSAPTATEMAPSTPKPPAPDPSPAIYKRWWFWTGAGAVVVAGVTTAVLLSRGEQDPVRGNVDPGVVVLR